MKYTYLLIDFFSVIVPFIFSFHPRLKFHKHWNALFPAIIATAIVFIGWDMYFTGLKIWGFNREYLTGIYIGNLPVEEILFFICIPYSCVFTYACLNMITAKRMSKSAQLIISSSLIAISGFMVLYFHELSYTAWTFALLAILLVTAQYILKADWLSRFYVTYLLLLLPFLIVNGLLTGTGLAAPVVWYNHTDMVNLRILTIPFEDIFYGMDLILLNIIIYSLLCARYIKGAKSKEEYLVVSNN